MELAVDDFVSAFFVSGCGFEGLDSGNCYEVSAWGFWRAFAGFFSHACFHRSSRSRLSPCNPCNPPRAPLFGGLLSTLVGGRHLLFCVPAGDDLDPKTYCVPAGDDLDLKTYCVHHQFFLFPVCG